MEPIEFQNNLNEQIEIINGSLTIRSVPLTAISVMDMVTIEGEIVVPDILEPNSDPYFLVSMESYYGNAYIITNGTLYYRVRPVNKYIAEAMSRPKLLPQHYQHNADSDTYSDDTSSSSSSISYDYMGEDKVWMIVDPDTPGIPPSFRKFLSEGMNFDVRDKINSALESFLDRF